MSLENSSLSTGTTDQINLLERNEEIRNENNYTPAGEKLKSHGITYHDHVIMLYLCKFMMKENFNYNLTCEVDVGGKFDDIIIFYEQNNQVMCRFIQVKSKTSSSLTLTKSILVGKDKRFSLIVYFLSYLEIVMKYNFETKFGCKIKDLILHTNIDVDQQLKQDLETYEDEFFGRGGFYYFKGNQSDYRKSLVQIFVSSLQDDIMKREKKLREININRTNNKTMTEKEKLNYDEEKIYLEYLKHLTLDEKNKYADDFLDKLKFHVKQPDRDQLSGLIKMELNKCLKKYKLYSPQHSNQLIIAYTNLYNKIYTFHSDPNVKILTNKHFFDWFKEASRCRMTQLEACHSLNMKFLTNREFCIKEESIITLERSIKNSNCNFLNIVANAGSDFALIKLNVIFRNSKFCLITDQQFLSMSGILENDMEDEKTEYLIVKCENNITSDILLNIENFLFRIDDESENAQKIFKKLILVSKFNDRCSSEMCLQIIDETTWSDLHEVSRKQIEDENVICLQGQDVTLTRVEISNYSDLLKNEILYDIVYSKKMMIGKSIDSENVCNISSFIERRVCLQNKISADIFKVGNENDIFMISNIHEAEFRKLESLSKSHLICSTLENSQRHFIDLCTQYVYENVTWLYHENGEFFCRGSKSIDKIRPYVIGSFPRFVDMHLLTSIDDRVILIIAEPGMGKSDLLSVLALRMVEETPSVLVIKINLVNCSTEFAKMLEKELTFNEQNEAIDFLIKTQLCNSDGYKKTFEREYFKRHFSFSDRLIVLLDGFDEIAPDYRSIVIDLIKLIASIKSIKLCVTSRPQEKKLLETELNVLSYSLVRFTTDDQNNFFLAYWTKPEIDSHGVQKERLKRFVERLINVTSKSLRDNDQLMTGIPLQCRMLGEVYQETFEEYYNSEQDDVSEYLPASLDILELYEKFLVKKRFIYEKDKLKRDRAITGNKIHSSKDECHFIKIHSYLGFCTVFAKSNRDDILSDKDKKKIDEYIREVESGEERVGILNIAENGTSGFLHKTFAEYFAARWFHYRISTDNANKQKLVDFFKSHFFKSEFETVRHFFDRLSAKDAIFKAVLNNDKKSIIDLLATNSTTVESLADFNRNVLHLCAAYEYNDLIRILIENRADMTVKDDLCRWTPIEYACVAENWRNVNTFLSKNDNDNSAYELIKDKNILLHASENAHLNLVKYLINCGTSVNSINNKNETSLHLAARKGHFEICSYLVEEAAAAIDICDIDGDCALHYAARGGNVNIVKVLVRAKSHVDAVNKKGCSPLHSAAYFGHYETFRYLLEETGAKIDIFDNDGDSILHYAARGGNKDIIKMLVEKNLNVNAANHKGCTPLHSAGYFGKYDIFKYLIEETNADIHVCDADGDSILQYTARGGSVYIARLLIDARVNVNKANNKGCAPLQSAAYFGNYEMFKYLVKEAGATIDIFDADGDSVLHYVARGGNLSIAEILLAKNVNINVANNKNSTPIHAAAFFGHYDIFKCLVEKANANIDVCDNDGDSVLHYAARGGNVEIVKILIDKQCNVDKVNHKGCVPLHSAAYFSRLEVFKYLMEKTHANIHICDKDNDSVLHYAARGGNLDIVKILVRANVNVNAVNNKNCTPLHSASYFGHDEVINYLIEEANARIDIYDKDNDSVLHFAARSGKINAVKVLIHHKLDINYVNSKGCSPLLSAAYFGKYDVLKYLIQETNANIHSVDFDDDSILHYAARGGNVDVVKLLVAQKVDVNILNRRKLTPLHCATYFGHREVAKYFIEETDVDLDLCDINGYSVLDYAEKYEKIDIKKIILYAKLRSI